MKIKKRFYASRIWCFFLRKKQLTDASKATKVISNGEDIQVIFTGEEYATEPTQVIPAPSTSSPAPHLSETFIGQKYKKFENLKLDDDEEPTKNTVVQPGNKKK